MPEVTDVAPLDANKNTPREEIANVATHGLGLLLAIAAAAIGCVVAVETGSLLRVVTVAIFTAALVLTYFASTGFHFFGRSPRRHRWRLLDHASIYTLIAATYTPIMLVAVGGTWGWSIVTLVWLMAIVGVTLKVVTIGRYDRFEKIDTGLYLAMGWMSLVAIVPIWMNLSATALTWLFIGGLAYSGGCIFFLWDRLPYNHAIWHLFVLLGSLCHYVVIVGHVVPSA